MSRQVQPTFPSIPTHIEQIDEASQIEGQKPSIRKGKRNQNLQLRLYHSNKVRTSVFNTVTFHRNEKMFSKNNKYYMTMDIQEIVFDPNNHPEEKISRSPK